MEKHQPEPTAFRLATLSGGSPFTMAAPPETDGRRGALLPPYLEILKVVHLCPLGRMAQIGQRRQMLVDKCPLELVDKCPLERWTNVHQGK